jgi:hypothetical protein
MNQTWEALAAGVYRCRLAFLDVTVGLILGREGVLLIDSGTTFDEAARSMRTCGASMIAV